MGLAITPLPGRRAKTQLGCPIPTEAALKIDLPGDATSFQVPNGWLQAGTEYVLDIKVISDNGNQTVRDVVFETAD